MLLSDFKARMMAQPVHRRLHSYPTDVSDDQWHAIRPLLPHPMLVSPNRQIDLRDVIDAFRFWALNDIPTRDLPADLPNPNSVRYFLYRWQHDGVLDNILQTLGDERFTHAVRKRMKVFNTADVKRHNQYIAGK